MSGPGTTSGSYGFGLSNGMILLECFERLGIEDPQVIRNKIRTATISMNLELQRFCSPARGPSLFNVLYGQTINLVEGEAVYPISNQFLAITEMWYSQPNGNGSGLPLDRIMVPLSRQQYSMVPNKLQPGTPNNYWFEKIPVQQVTIWPPPQQGAPTYVLNYNVIQRPQDANIGSGETPDLAYRALDAFCARLAYRLVKKVLPRSEWAVALPAMKADADDAFADFTSEDQEDGPMIMQPNIGPYGRM